MGAKHKNALPILSNHLLKAIFTLFVSFAIAIAIPATATSAYGKTLTALDADMTDLGLSVQMGTSDYLGMSTAMGKYQSGKVDFTLAPSDGALLSYQTNGHPDATAKEMLQDWANAITSFTLDGVTLTQKPFAEWLGQIAGPAADAVSLRYFSLTVNNASVTISVPVVFFGEDDFSAETFTVASTGFADTSGTLAYRNYGADSITIRVLDKPAVDGDGAATDYQVLREYTLTDAELRALTTHSDVLTSANCGMAGLRTYKSEGVYLTDLLDAAGVDFGPGMTLITRTTDCASTNDGAGGTETAYYGFDIDETTGAYEGNGTFSYEDLMGQARYHYPAMWDDTTIYDSLDGKTIYSYLSTNKDSWRKTYKGLPEKATVLTQLIGDTKTQVASPMIAWAWCEGVVAWGGTDPATQTFGTSDYNPYTSHERYRFLYGMTANSDGSLANEETQFKNCYGVFGIDIIDPDYTPKTYSITYELNGGTNDAANPDSYTVGSTVSLATPTRSGYTFTGWFTDRACATAFSGISERTTGDVTVYAGWEKDSYDFPAHDQVATDVTSFEVYTDHYGTPFETENTIYGGTSDNPVKEMLDYQVINVKLTFDDALTLADPAVLAQDLEVSLNKSTSSDPADYTCTYVSTVDEMETLVKSDPNPFRYTISGLSDNGKTLTLQVYIGYAIIDGRLAISCAEGGAQGLAYADGRTGHPLMQLGTTIVPNGLEAYTVSARVATADTPAQTVTRFVAPTTAGRLVTRGKVHIIVLKNGIPVGEVLNSNWATSSATHWHNYLDMTVNDYLASYFGKARTYPGGMSYRLGKLGLACDITVSDDQITITADESESGDIIEVFVSSYLNNGQLTLDKTALTQAIDTAERLVAKGAPAGKEDTFALLENALALGKTSLASNYYSQQVIDEKTDALNAAIEALGKDAITHSVTYVLDGGTNASSNPTTYVEGFGVTLANPTKDDYTFKGWFSDAAFTQQVTAISADATSDITLYAQWEKISHDGFTVVDQRKTGITITPNLTVTGQIVATITVPDSTTAAYQTLAAHLGSDTLMGVFGIDLTVDGVETHDDFGSLTVAFPLPAALEGKTVVLSHLHANGTVDSQYLKVSGGSVTVTVTDLSTFMLSMPNKLPFPDVQDSSAWYYRSVMRVAERGLITGYGNGYFGPGDTLTRAQAATILWRYYTGGGSGSEANSTGMADVGDYQWYTAAANWAVDQKVISGKGGTSFDPDGRITREELCAIVANASARFAGSSAKGADRKKLDAMPDASSVSSWAVDSVAWGLNEGVISGKGSGSSRVIDPQGQVTRAEMAAILMNSIDRGLL